MFDKERYQGFLGREGGLVYLDEVDSTNAYAVANDLPPFTVVLADVQTAGRGRSGRKWHSDTSENLYFSVVMEKLSPNMLLPLNIFAGYMLCDSLKSFVNAKVKWPNDMTVNGKKLAGILMETSFSGGSLEKLVIGVGLNVNSESFPDEISGIATSLFIETGQKFEREQILANFMSSLQNSFDYFKNGHLEISKLWSNYSAFLDKKIAIHKDGVKTEYIEKGIDGTGCLLALDESGSLKTIVTGDIGYDFCR